MWVDGTSAEPENSTMELIIEISERSQKKKRALIKG